MNNKLLRKVKLRGFILGAAAVLLIAVGVITVQKQSAQAASTYPYLLKVNKVQNCITIYEKDKKGNYTVPVKSMICSTGWATPTGTFKTPSKYRWKILLEDVWGQYSTRITGSILFHSVWYYQQDPSTLSAKEYNRLGTTCSHGCIRITVADAKWIYDNCPIGTTVTIYNDSKSPGPLGKPQAMKLQQGTGWDPTDVTNPNNPFNSKKPSISGTADKTVKFGTTVDLKKGISAKSTTGYSITSDIKIDGKVNTKKAGKYKITYSVTDLLNRTASKTIYYTVLADDSKPVLTGVTDKIVGPDTEINRTTLLKGVKVKMGNKTLSTKGIKVSIVDNGDDTYSITYQYTAPNGKKAVKKSTITADRTAPEIKGIADKEIAWDTVVDSEFVLENVTAADNISSKKIKVTTVITQNEDDIYTIVYTAKDNFGNTTTETVTYTITDFLRIKGAIDITVTPGVLVNEEYVKQGVVALDKDVDVSDKMEVTISELENNNYTVTYLIKDDKGHEEKATAIFTLETQEQTDEQQTDEQQTDNQQD